MQQRLAADLTPYHLPPVIDVFLTPVHLELRVGELKKVLFPGVLSNN